MDDCEEPLESKDASLAENMEKNCEQSDLDLRSHGFKPRNVHCKDFPSSAHIYVVKATKISAGKENPATKLRRLLQTNLNFEN